MNIRKFVFSLALLLSLVGSDLLYASKVEAATCPVPTNSAYKSISSNAVYFVTSNCTKRAFTNSVVFYSYYSSFKSAKKVTAKQLAKIPNDKLGVMELNKIVIAPEVVQLPPGGTTTFTAKVSGGVVDETVWSIVNNAGNFTTSGLYVAPTTPGTYYVTAWRRRYGGYVRRATSTVVVIPPVTGGGGGSSAPAPTTGGGGGTVTPSPAPAPAPVPPVVPTPPPVVVPTPPPAPVSNQALVNYKYGIADASLPYLSDAELNNRLDDLVALGVGWVRVDFDWNSIQPNNSNDYSWAHIDRVVTALNARNIKLLPILTYTPVWARPANCTQSAMCAPADNAKFAAFAVTAVKRYANQGVHTWEIWNEPNSVIFWRPVANANEYANLLKAVYPAIKGADSSAIVITGGTSPAVTSGGNIAPVDFLDQLYKSGAKASFDAVSHHPYSYPAPPTAVESWSGWSQTSETNPSMRSVMVANGDSGKQIWLTEVGAPTGGPGALATESNLNYSVHPDHVDENLQAVILQEAITRHQSFSWAGPMFWYSYKDLSTSNNSNENFFGLLRNDGSKKPSYDTFKNLVKPKTP